jgi:hypothetical protein
MGNETLQPYVILPTNPVIVLPSRYVQAGKFVPSDGNLPDNSLLVLPNGYCVHWKLNNNEQPVFHDTALGLLTLEKSQVCEEMSSDYAMDLTVRPKTKMTMEEKVRDRNPQFLRTNRQSKKPNANQRSEECTKNVSCYNCEECNIVFHIHENYLVHKEHYCASRLRNKF